MNDVPAGSPPTPPLPLHPLCERFLRFQATVKNRTKETVGAYRFELRFWSEFLAGQCEGRDVVTASRDNAENYLYWRKTHKDPKHQKTGREQLSAAAMRRTFSALSSFYTWATKQRHLEHNPMVGLEPGKREKRVARVFEDHELRALVTEILKPRSEEDTRRHAWARTWRRDFAMIHLMAYLGLRRSEVARLDWRNVSFESRQVIVLGKGNKERRLHLHPRAYKALAELREYGRTSETAIFVDCRSDDPVKWKRLSPWSVTRAVRLYIEEADLPDGLSAHKLRHAFATALLNAGADIRDIAEQLGHESLEATKIYTHVKQDRIRNLVDQIDYSG